MKRPSHAACKALAGSPLLLAASEEQAIREEWERMERVYRAAMKWYRSYSKAVNERTPKNIIRRAEAAEALHYACDAARKKGSR